MPVPHILVVGSLNTDLITRTPVVPLAGETLTASSFFTGSGGKGANQAVACARASRNSDHAISEAAIAQVSMVGGVGDDPYGTQLLKELSSNGVNIGGVKVHHGEVSGVAIILVEESSGENRILITPGANGRVVFADFDNFLAKTKPELVVLQLEIPLYTVLAVLESAKKQGIECLLNPAPAVKLPEAAFKGLGHLVMNETEAGILAGWGGDSVDENELKQVFDKFEALGVKNTIVTLGGKGVSYGLGQGKFGRVAAEKVAKVVDTTAAGDTFVGTYSVEVVQAIAAGRPMDVEAAAAKANKAAARTVEKAGAMNSIPWRSEV